MKNFKKLIALVLVVAMIASFATMTSATFTDNADIDYAEAVDVMVALGVINGYEDGSFNPTGDVTRAEMAKMIAFIMNSGTDIGEDGAASCAFTDCYTGYWANGYIAFVDAAGIVDGRGDGTFDPDATVTGTEAAKMMLTALGYDSDYEGYTGSSWSANVMMDAKDAGLTDDMSGFSWTGNCSREEAAMMLLNTLTATMVSYSGGTSFTGTDISFSVAGEMDYRVNTSYSYISGDSGYSYLQMCENYFDDLIYYDSDNDLLGRDAHKWVYDLTTVGTYADSVDYTVFADEDETLADFIYDDVDDDFGYTDSSDNYASIYLNGDEEIGDDAADTLKLEVGDVVEIYMSDSETDVIDNVVVIRYTYTTIDDIDEDDDIDDCVIYFDDGSEMIDEDSIGFAAFYADAGVDADVLTVVNDSDDVVLAEYPTIVTGDITYVNSSDSYLKMDGTTYYFTGFDDAPSVTDDDEESALYINSYGYVVYTDNTDDSNDDEALAIVKTYQALNSDSELVYMATAVFSDGTTDAIEVSNNNDGAYTVGALCTFSVDDDDAYTLKEVSSSATVGVTGPDSSTLTGVYTVKGDSDGTDMFSSSSKLGGTYYYDSDVLFIFIDEDDKDVTVYEGVTSYTPAYNVEETVMFTVDDTTNEYVTAVFITGTADSEVADEVIFLAGTTTGSEKVNGETYYGYDAYYEGKAISDFYADYSSYKQGFYEYSIGDDGEYELTGVSSETGDDEEYAYYANATVAVVENETYISINGDGAFDSDEVFNLSDAKIVDIYDDTYNTVAKLQKLKDGLVDDETIKVYVIGETENYTASVIYITDYQSDASEDAGLTSVTLGGEKIDMDADSYKTAKGSINTKIDVENGYSLKNLVVTTSNKFASYVITVSTRDSEADLANTDEDSLTDITGNELADDDITYVVIEVVVTAEDGNASETYYGSVEITCGTNS